MEATSFTIGSLAILGVVILAVTIQPQEMKERLIPNKDPPYFTKFDPTHPAGTWIGGSRKK